MRRRNMLGTLIVMGLALPPAAHADLYNPVTMQDVPSSYYYPPPAPTVDPPPMVFPPLDLTSSSGSSGSSSGGGSTSPATRKPRQERVLGYRRSAKVSRQANRQMAALFAKRLGKANFDRARFLKEADKGTFRAAFRQVVQPLGWSDTDFADALAGFLVSSYMVVNGEGALSDDEIAGARKLSDDLRASLLKDRRMTRQTDRSKQLVTERLNTMTIVQLAQWGNGDATARAAQAAATRQAGLKTFKGDLGAVRLTASGLAPR